MRLHKDAWVVGKRIAKKLIRWNKSPLTKEALTAKASEDAWNYFERALAVLPSNGIDRKIRKQFERDGLWIGQISTPLVMAFLNAIEKASNIPFRTDGFSPVLYHRHHNLSPYLASLKNDHVWKEVNAEVRWFIAEIMDEICPQVINCIGGEWRPLNIRLWKTHPKAEETAAHEWHKDGLLPGIIKIMAYFSEVGPGKGTVEMVLPGGGIKILEGPPGTWMLFKNSEILHRALAPDPDQPDRIALEITLARSIRCKPWPAFSSINSIYPIFPWYETQN